MLLLGPLIVTARDANISTCKIGEADEYTYEDDRDAWIDDYF